MNSGEVTCSRLHSSKLTRDANPVCLPLPVPDDLEPGSPFSYQGHGGLFAERLGVKGSQPFSWRATCSVAGMVLLVHLHTESPSSLGTSSVNP